MIDKARDGFTAVVDRIRGAVRDGLDAMKGTFDGGAGHHERLYRGAVAGSVVTPRLPRRKHGSRPRI